MIYYFAILNRFWDVRRDLKKIALFSYGYLTADPRIITIADSLKAHDWDVVCINVYPSPLKNMDDYVLFKKHNCHNLIIYPGARVKRVLSRLLSAVFNRVGLRGLGESLFFKSTNTYIKKAIQSKAFRELVKSVDVFYSCEMFFGAFIAYYAAEQENKKFIFDIKELYSDMAEKSTPRVKQFIVSHEKLFIEQSAVLPCVSEGIAEYYSGLYPEFKEKYVHLPNTPSKTSGLTNLAPPLSEARPIRFVMLSGFAPEIRGIEALIQIWEKLNPQNAMLDLYLSNLSDAHKKQLLSIAPQSAGKSFQIKAPIKEDDIIPMFTQYDVGIVPYLPDACLNHRYCCPGKFGQYLKAGLMVVASNTEGITKPIEAFDLGRVYEPRELLSSCQVFQNVIDNPALVHATKTKAQQFFNEHYHWDKFAEDFVNRLTNIDWYV